MGLLASLRQAVSSYSPRFCASRHLKELCVCTTDSIYLMSCVPFDTGFPCGIRSTIWPSHGTIHGVAWLGLACHGRSAYIAFPTVSACMQISRCRSGRWRLSACAVTQSLGAPSDTPTSTSTTSLMVSPFTRVWRRILVFGIKSRTRELCDKANHCRCARLVILAFLRSK